MQILKQSGDYLDKLELFESKSLLNSYTWQDRDQKISFLRNKNNAWRIHCSKVEFAELYSLVADLEFPTRKAALQTAQSLLPDYSGLDRLRRRENIMYHIVGTPLDLAGKGGFWYCRIRRQYQKNSEGKIVIVPKYHKLCDAIFVACSHNNTNVFSKNGKAQAIDFFINWVEEHHPDFFKDETWAFKALS